MRADRESYRDGCSASAGGVESETPLSTMLLTGAVLVLSQAQMTRPALQREFGIVAGTIKHVSANANQLVHSSTDGLRHDHC